MKGGAGTETRIGVRLAATEVTKHKEKGGEREKFFKGCDRFGGGWFACRDVYGALRNGVEGVC